MKLILFIFSLVSLVKYSYSQDHLTGTRELLMKYWYYRERLKKDFMQFADPWKRGASEPASVRGGYIFTNSFKTFGKDRRINIVYYRTEQRG